MILYVCDTCRSSIEASELRQGGALLVGDRAYCRRCNPRRQEDSSAAGSQRPRGGPELACDSCAQEIPARDLRGGAAGPSGGLLLCATCLGGGARPAAARSAQRGALPHHGAAPARSRVDGVYVAGLVGLFVLLPAVAAFVAYRMGSERSGEEVTSPAPGGSDDSRAAIGERAVATEIVELRQENARLLERLDRLSGDLAQVQRDRAAGSQEPARDPGGELLVRQLETLDRTIQRLESSLGQRIEVGVPAPPPGDVASATPAESGAVAPLRDVPAAPPPGGVFGLLLDALAAGQTLPAGQLLAYLDDEDASIRMLACKVAGAAATAAPGSSIDLEVLKKVMRRLHDRDVAVQRAAIAAASAINGERYVAWDELDARDYAMMARIRQMWDGVEARADSDEDRTRGGGDR